MYVCTCVVAEFKMEEGNSTNRCRKIVWLLCGEKWFFGFCFPCSVATRRILRAKKEEKKKEKKQDAKKEN